MWFLCLILLCRLMVGRSLCRLLVLLSVLFRMRLIGRRRIILCMRIPRIMSFSILLSLMRISVCLRLLRFVPFLAARMPLLFVLIKESVMARKGVAILREIAMVKASDMPLEIRAAMLKELNDELVLLYAPKAVDDRQGVLPLDKVKKA